MNGAARTARDPADEARQANREHYDRTDTALWRLAVFGRGHGGRPFLDMADETLLAGIAAEAALGDGSELVDLCCGEAGPAMFLAAGWKCRVTAIDMNPRQIARATENVEAAGLAGRIELVEADCAFWQPSRPYDLAISIDSAMLLPDVAGLCRTAFRALRPGGSFALTTIVDRATDAGERDFLESEDGMFSLLPAARHDALLRAAGFATVGVSDITETALRFLSRLDAALAEFADEIDRDDGPEARRNWLRVNGLYRRLFQERKLGYALITGGRA